MRAVFIGSVDFSVDLLKAVLITKGMEVVGVVTKTSSTFNADFASLAPLAEEHGIDCFIYDNKTKDQMGNWVLSKEPDVVFCFGWSHLIGLELIKNVPQGVIGYHPAALPMNRGRHPIIWALVLGLKETASSFFVIDEGADTGDIVHQVKLKISLSDDAGTLYKKLNKIAISQVKDIARALVKGKLKKKKQNHDKASSWRKRSAIDGKIDWRMNSVSILNLVRGLTRPYLGASFSHDGREFIVWKAGKSSLKNKLNWEPGKIASIKNKTITVKTADGFIELKEHNFDLPVKEGDYL